jgi:hypothetical protein
MMSKIMQLDAPMIRIACLWDGLCNNIRAAHNKYSISPIWSRAQNIGYYGNCQDVSSWDGSDLKDPETIRRCKQFTPEFMESYSDWDHLIMLDGKDYYLTAENW